VTGRTHLGGGGGLGLGGGGVGDRARGLHEG
jgi:hypothetical protein